jgi:hypothetical protein
MNSKELKSKVMTLGNKLAPGMGDRRQLPRFRLVEGEHSRGRENAIGNEAYYQPRLEALRDAIERELI